MFSFFAHFSPQKISRVDRKTLGKAAIILLIGLLLWIFRSELLTVIGLLSDRDGLIRQIQKYGAVGAVILVIVFILQVIIAALPAKYSSRDCCQ